MIKLSKRLSTVASFVRNGVIVADVGTDHAYLPIYLVQSKKAKKAIATDINEGPLSRARENILQNGLENEILTYISNGLNGIESNFPDDIMICGMGGELIAEILDKSNYVKNGNVNLILQPMTSAKELREYLQNGFFIYDETVVFEDGKFYQIICAKYDGQKHEFSEIELEVGKINIMNKSNDFKEFIAHTIEKKKKIFLGLKKSGRDTTGVEKEIEDLEKLK